MSAYIIVEVKIHDPQTYEAYKKLTPGSLAPFGGEFTVRGGNPENMEGDWNPERIVVLKFPDKEKAKSWWHSDIYSQAKPLRYKAAESKMILVEGA